MDSSLPKPSEIQIHFASAFAAVSIGIWLLTEIRSLTLRGSGRPLLQHRSVEAPRIVPRMGVCELQRPGKIGYGG